MTIQEWQGLAAGWDDSPYGSGPVPHSRYVMIGSGEFSFDPSLTDSVRHDLRFHSHAYHIKSLVIEILAGAAAV